MFKKLLAFFHRHPAIKTTMIGAAGAAGSAAAAGALGPKAQVVAAGLIAAGVLHVKRPADATAQDKGEVR
jgi:hypothetical protein